MSALIVSLGFLINSLRHYSNIKIGAIPNEFPSLMLGVASLLLLLLLLLLTTLVTSWLVLEPMLLSFVLLAEV